MAEAIPLLHQVSIASLDADRENGRLFTCFWIPRLDQGQQDLRWNHLLHFGQEFLAFGALFRRRLNIDGETQLVAAQQLSLGLRSQGH